MLIPMRCENFIHKN